MNKICFNPTFYLTGTTILLFSFLLAGCGSYPTEVRHDNSMRKYSVGKEGKTYSNQKSGVKYTVGQHDDATAHYALRQKGSSEPYSYDPHKKVSQQSESDQHQSSIPSDIALVIEATNILFDFDKYVIKKSVVPELDEWVTFFNENPAVTAVIIGHADSIGSSKYNLNLSEKRAKAVVNYMVSKGIATERLTPKGLGETQPAALNTTSEGRQKNRRVDVGL